MISLLNKKSAIKVNYPIYNITIWVIMLLCFIALLPFFFTKESSNNSLVFFNIWTIFSITTGLFAAILSFIDFTVRKSLALSLFGVVISFAIILDVNHYFLANSSPENDLIELSTTLNFTYYILGLTGISILYKKSKAKNLRLPQQRVKIFAAFVFITSAIALSIFYSLKSHTISTTLLRYTHIINFILLIITIIWGVILMKNVTLRYPRVFLKYLMLSAVPLCLAEILLIYNDSNFNYSFNSVHFLKLLAYLTPFAGIIVNYIEILINEQKVILQLDQEIKQKQKLTDYLLVREELLTNAEKISNLGSWVLDFKTNSYTWSNQLFKIYGINDTNYQPSSSYIETIVIPSYREKVFKELTAAINNKSNFAVEYQIILPNNQKRYVLNQGYYVSKEQQLVGTVQDITELKEATLKLRKNETLLREGEAVANNGSWEWQSNNEIILWSQEMYNIHGYLPHSTFATIHNYIQFVHPDDRRQLKFNFLLALKNKASLNVAYRIIRPNGELRYIATIGKFKANENGEGFTYLGNTRDVTVLKETERILEEKIAELNSSNKDLEQFAYVASHDLQEPLRKIRAFGDRLKMKYAVELPEEGKDFVTRMQNAAERMQHLIDDLLTFSRVTRQTKIYKTVNLNDAFKQALIDLEYTIEQSKAKITIAVTHQISGIEAQLIQVFQNLISNSLKFTQSNTQPLIHISSSIKLGNKLPIKSANLNQEYCVIEVKDNGIGFNEVYASKIFDLFQRLHSRNEYPGTGIGLAICKKIIETHGGYIYANSKEGDSTSFFIALPYTIN